jgi:hypothetical protein
VVTYAAPKGWQREANTNSIQFGKEDAKGSIALITLFKQIPAGPDPKENFAAAWKEIVQGMVPAGEPQMEPASNENGWILESGTSPYEADGRKGVVMLVTATGSGKMVNLLILANSDEFQNEVVAFVASIRLPKSLRGRNHSVFSSPRTMTRTLA